MPIRFRCGYCSRLLGIARRKAGTNTTCPHCGAIIAVPVPDSHDGAADSGPELAEIDKLLGAERSANGSGGSPAAVATPRMAEGFSTTPSSPADHSTPAPSAGLKEKKKKPKPAPHEEPVAPLQEVFSLTEAESKPLVEKPLFEHDLDAVLDSKTPTPKPRKKKHKPAAGADAMSLDDAEATGSSKIAAFAIGAVVVVILAFVAGYFVGAS